MREKYKQGKIVLLEDDYDSMVMLKEILEKEKWLVELSASKDILTRLSSEYFDLILLDVMIHPQSRNGNGDLVENIHFLGVNWQRTGLEFLTRLRQGEFSKKNSQGTPPEVPVILLSAIATNSTGLEAETTKLAQAHFEKPFRLKELLESIHTITGR